MPYRYMRGMVVQLHLVLPSAVYEVLSYKLVLIRPVALRIQRNQ